MDTSSFSWYKIPEKEEYAMNHPALVTKSTVRYVFSLFLVNARESKGLTQERLAELR